MARSTFAGETARMTLQKRENGMSFEREPVVRA